VFFCLIAKKSCSIAIVGNLNIKDKVVAGIMALVTISMLGALSALLALGTNQALAEPTDSPQQTSAPVHLPGAEALGAIFVGGFCLSLTRRLLGR
jgi:hypothetical protein